jgi:hypothetical protein
VIERISGIQTPRSTNTCTRCPLFIKLEPAKDPRSGWEAHVSLRTSFMLDGKTGKIGKARERRFPGWRQVPTLEDDFATTTSPDELEELIARAQLAILSQDVDQTLFLREPLENLKYAYPRADFSPNVVCIYITQPGLPPLSFYDLPGIIGQSEDASKQHLVPFVKDLVAEYVANPQTLVLVTCSLATDVANSTAAGIARGKNASERCIGRWTNYPRLNVH